MQVLRKHTNGSISLPTYSYLSAGWRRCNEGTRRASKRGEAAPARKWSRLPTACTCPSDHLSQTMLTRQALRLQSMSMLCDTARIQSAAAEITQAKVACCLWVY
jgi:hypothetical protein